MSDRIVHPIDLGSTRSVRFSDCLHLPNIVLLGDPGAGKSHLFRTFAPSSGLFRARDFLNFPVEALREHSTIFIDALDEKRSSRTDVSPVDLIVSRLLELMPRHVRIACRAADWLGTSDLGAFKPYFDRTGGFTVLCLEEMNHDECMEVLTTLGCPDPSAFIVEANDRGVGDLLGNPQNLMMLFQVVQSNDWPHTRSELYQKSVELLLAEHNPEHQAKDIGAFSERELMRASGAACAARLISDVSGIALSSAKIAGYPSYRDLVFLPEPELQASLKRRVFTATGVPDTVDYSHRTIAEYLAAHFLAHQVRRGLPFGRVRAVISLDGRPASELRGLHAWLAVLLPEHATELIEADPFGVLSYGDAAALGLAERTTLLECMSELAKRDPWFRNGSWSAAPLRGLAGADMVDRFRCILRHSDNYSLISLVLDAASVGAVMPELKDDFLQILTDTSRGEGERVLALEALLHLGPSVNASCIDAYAAIAAEPGKFHIRTRILRRLLQQGLLGAKEIASLLNDALAEPRDSVIRMGLYDFSKQVQDKSVRQILDLVECERLPRKGTENQYAREALRVIDHLLARYLTTSPEHYDYVAKWLCKRWLATRYRGYGVDEALQKVLRSSPELLEKLIDAAVPIIQETQAWPIVVRLGQVLPGAADSAAILSWALGKLVAAPSAPDPLHYEIAMNCVFTPEPVRRAEFDYLLTLASQYPVLQPTCDAACSWPIPDWRIEEIERRASTAAKRAQDQSKTRADFDKHIGDIRKGSQLGWLGHIAHIYFCLYADCNENSSPHARLIDLLGVERAQTALAGLQAMVMNGNAPDTSLILKTHADEKVCRWWYAMVAGLDEFFATNGDLGAFSPDYLSAALAVSVLYPTFEHAGNTTAPTRHAWVAWFAQQHPHEYSKTLATIVRFRFQKESQYIDGFTELLKLPAEARIDIVRGLLFDFPQASANYLVQLLRAWIDAQPKIPDLSLVRQGLRKTAGTSSHAFWMAAALVIDFGKFRSQAIAIRKKDAQRNLVRASRDLLGYSRPVPLAYTEYFLSLTCRCFKRRDMPLDSGEDRHDWDATQFALALQDTLASDISDRAQRALNGVLRDKRTRHFHDDIKHAIAQQQVRRIDAGFRQPSWEATLATLSNGVPANMGDLQALVVAELRDLQVHLAGSNIDLYKNFWNEGSHGQAKSPKPENSCRNSLVLELRRRLVHHGIRVEPEGHMARQRRTDIAVTIGNMKLVLELKRHFHPEVWTAAAEQLERFYVRDPESKGYGIYVVFWFGAQKPTPALGKGKRRPRCADEMETALTEGLPIDYRHRIVCAVLDVSSGKSQRRVSNTSSDVHAF